MQRLGLRQNGDVEVALLAAEKVYGITRRKTSRGLVLAHCLLDLLLIGAEERGEHGAGVHP